MPLSPNVPDIAALDLLLTVARMGSLGRAARAHGISQPAAGSRIKHLEDLLGMTLIDRSALGSRLTEEGALVADWAREVVSKAAALEAGVAALRSRRAGRLKIAASLTIAEYLVPSWLMDLRARRPDVVVSLRVANSTEVSRLVLAGEVGLGFIEGPRTPAGLENLVLSRDRLLLVVAPDHPWAGKRAPVDAVTLAATALVQREPGSGTRDTIEHVLGGHGGLAEPVVELSSTTAIKAAVEAGVGPGVLSTLAVADELRRGVLVAVEVIGADMSRELRAVWCAGQRPDRQLQDVLAVATRHA